MHPAVPQTVNPLKGHHKYRHVEDLSEGSAGFVVRAEIHDTQEQVQLLLPSAMHAEQGSQLPIFIMARCLRLLSSSLRGVPKQCGGLTERCLTFVCARSIPTWSSSRRCAPHITAVQHHSLWAASSWLLL